MAESPCTEERRFDSFSLFQRKMEETKEYVPVIEESEDRARFNAELEAGLSGNKRHKEMRRLMDKGLSSEETEKAIKIWDALQEVTRDLAADKVKPEVGKWKTQIHYKAELEKAKSAKPQPVLTAKQRERKKLMEAFFETVPDAKERPALDDRSMAKLIRQQRRQDLQMKRERQIATKKHLDALSSKVKNEYKTQTFVHKQEQWKKWHGMSLEQHEQRREARLLFVKRLIQFQSRKWGARAHTLWSRGIPREDGKTTPPRAMRFTITVVVDPESIFEGLYSWQAEEWRVLTEGDLAFNVDKARQTGSSGTIELWTDVLHRVEQYNPEVSFVVLVQMRCDQRTPGDKQLDGKERWLAVTIPFDQEDRPDEIGGTRPPLCAYCDWPMIGARSLDAMPRCHAPGTACAESSLLFCHSVCKREHDKRFHPERIKGKKAIQERKAAKALREVLENNRAKPTPEQLAALTQQREEEIEILDKSGVVTKKVTLPATFERNAEQIALSQHRKQRQAERDERLMDREGEHPPFADTASLWQE